MVSFKEYFLQEKLITFPDPKEGNVVILAGSGGSGKGFILSNLLGITGKVIDVDALKMLAVRSPILIKKYPELKDVDFSNPQQVAMVHDIVNDRENLDDKSLIALKKSISQSKRLQNIIFDNTLKDFSRLEKISKFAIELGYKLDHVHLIWVIADIEQAKKQNLERKRRVPEEVLVKASRGVALTMKQVINDSEKTRNYLDGSIWIVFNSKGDNELETTKTKNAGFGGFLRGERNQGNYVKKSSYVQIKKPGKPIDSTKLTPETLQKIKNYTPTGYF